MEKQVLVLGLGQFGMSVVRSLAELELEVLAVDARPELVRTAAEYAAEAVCFDVTDDIALARVAPQSRDVCVCAIGNESREASIICTALLRQMGAPRVISRATDPVHERILKMIGAHETFNPEREFGRRLASHIAHEGVLGEYPLSEGVAITEIRAPEVFWGRSLKELELRKRFGMTVVAVQRESETHTAFDPGAPLKSGDVLVVVGKTGMVAKLMQKVGQ